MKTKLTAKSVSALTPQGKLYKVWDSDLAGFFIKVRPSGTKTYGIWYRVAGKASEYTIGKDGPLTTEQARKLAKAALGDVAKGIDVQAEKAKAREQREVERTQTLGIFLEERYLPWAIAHQKTGAEQTRRIQATFKAWLDKSMVSITPWLVQKWRAGRLKAGMKPSSINRRTATLRGILSKALEWHVIDHHPLAGLKQLKLDSKGKVRYLSHDEEERLRRALLDRETRMCTERASANQWRSQRGYDLLPDLTALHFVDHLQPIVLLALNTGMRRGELFNLKWGDVNLSGRTITIRGEDSKSGQTRHIPLNDEALHVLTRWQEQNNREGYVFPAADGGRLNNIKKSFAGLLNCAEIDNFRFHDLRHHFASKLVMAGADLNTVRELLGHQSLEMTLRYAHLAPEHKAAAVALLDREAG